MRITHRTIVPAVLAAALFCPLALRPADAQTTKPRPPIAGVQVVVRDLSTQQDLGTVPPGGSISVPAGSHLRLIMTAIPTGNRAALYPETTYSDQSQGGVRITRSRSENSTADLEVGEAKGDRRQGISYQIHEDWVPTNLRNGSIYLQVVPAAAPQAPPASLTGSARAQEITRMLYLGILMREPDPGAQGTVDSIERGGYEAITQAAVGIANSDESHRIRVGTEERLNALYQNLLGMSPDQVDRAQYDGDLRRVSSGRLGDVVSAMVQSPRFQTRTRVNTNRY